VADLWQTHRQRAEFSRSLPQADVDLWAAVQASAKRNLNYLSGRGLLVALSRTQVLAWAKSNVDPQRARGHKVSHLGSDEDWWLELRPTELRFTRGEGALVVHREDPRARVELPTRVLPVVAVTSGESEERFALDLEALGLVMDWLGPASPKEVRRALLAWPQLFALLSIATYSLLIGVSEALGRPESDRPWLNPWTCVGVASLFSVLGSALTCHYNWLGWQGLSLSGFGALVAWKAYGGAGTSWWLVAGGVLLLVAEKLIQRRRFARRARSGPKTPP